MWAGVESTLGRIRGPGGRGSITRPVHQLGEQLPDTIEECLGVVGVVTMHGRAQLTRVIRVGVGETRGATRQRVIWMVLRPNNRVDWSTVRAFCCRKAEEMYTGDALRYMGKDAGCYDEFLVDGTHDLEQFIANLNFGESAYELALWLLRIKDDWPREWKHSIGTAVISATPRTDKVPPATAGQIKRDYEVELTRTMTDLVNVLSRVAEVKDRRGAIPQRAKKHVGRSLLEMAMELEQGVGR